MHFISTKLVWIWSKEGELGKTEEVKFQVKVKDALVIQGANERDVKENISFQRIRTKQIRPKTPSLDMRE